MVMAPGGYVFTDYVKFGVPLNALAMLLTVSISYFVWPVQPLELSASNSIVGNLRALPEASQLVSVLTAPGYESVLAAFSDPAANLTLFAPTDAAFAELGAVPDQATLIALLYYHGLSARVPSGALDVLQFPSTLMANASLVSLGDGVPQVLQVARTDLEVDVIFGIPGVPASTASVVRADVECSNGYIHLVDRVFAAPRLISETATTAGLNHFVTALNLTGLLLAVDSVPAVTAFAPTDAAFDAVEGWEDDLDLLRRILRYHVTVDAMYSTLLSDGDQLVTLLGNGTALTISVDADTAAVRVNGADVVLSDILVRNGVMHTIDTVLLPPPA